MLIATESSEIESVSKHWKTVLGTESQTFHYLTTVLDALYIFRL